MKQEKQNQIVNLLTDQMYLELSNKILDQICDHESFDIVYDIENQLYDNLHWQVTNLIMFELASKLEIQNK